MAKKRTKSKVDREALPAYKATNKVDKAGTRALQQTLEGDFGWIYRPIPRDTDFGLDAEVEIVDEKEQATGRLLGVQLKSGPSHLEEPKKDEENYVYYGKNSHRAYWLAGTLPVILVFSPQNGKPDLWVHVTPEAAQFTKKGWKIAVPKGQLLSHSKDALAQIAIQKPPGSVFMSGIPPQVLSLLDQEDEDFEYSVLRRGELSVIAARLRQGRSGSSYKTRLEIQSESLADWDSHVKKGVQAQVKARLLSSDLPLLQLASDESIKLVVGPQKMGHKLRLKIRASSPSLSQEFIDEFVNESYGSEEAIWTNNESTLEHKFRLTFKGAERSLNIQMHFRLAGSTAAAVLRSLDFYRALSVEDGSIEVVFDDSDIQIASTPVQLGILSQDDYNANVELYSAVRAIQQKTGTVLRMPTDDITEEQWAEILETAKIVTTGCLDLGQTSINATLVLTTSLNLDGPLHNFVLRPFDDKKVAILGHEINLGKQLLVIEKPNLPNVGRTLWLEGEHVPLEFVQEAGTAKLYYLSFWKGQLPKETHTG